MAVELDQPWARTVPARAAREVIIRGIFGGLTSWYCTKDVRGHEHLAGLDGPVIFVANHCSHADTPILLESLPGRFRRRTAVAAAADYFYADRKLAHLVSLAFCTVPLERRGGGLGEDAAAHVTRLFADGWSLVIYAEGTRSRDGVVGKLRSGAAVLAAEHGLPIVPVHTAGTHDAMPTGRSWMHRPPDGGRFARHPVRVTYGAPITVTGIGERLEAMERVRLHLEACGARTTPDPKLAARRAAAAAAAAQRAGTEA